MYGEGVGKGMKSDPAADGALVTCEAPSAAGKAGSTGTCSGGRIGDYVSGVLGTAPRGHLLRPQSVEAEIQPNERLLTACSIVSTGSPPWFGVVRELTNTPPLIPPPRGLCQAGGPVFSGGRRKVSRIRFVVDFGVSRVHNRGRLSHPSSRATPRGEGATRDKARWTSAMDPLEPNSGSDSPHGPTPREGDDKPNSVLTAGPPKAVSIPHIESTWRIMFRCL